MVRSPKLLTSAQRKHIKDRVRLRHNALLVELLGDNAVSKSALEELKNSGLYHKPRIDIIRRAFLFGKESLINKSVLSMSAGQFEDYLSSKGVVLTDLEREAVELLRRSFSNYMGALADTLRTKIDRALIKADRALQSKITQQQRRALYLELERRKAIASLAKDLGELTKEQLGNASRVVVTETNNAFQDGRAREIIRKAEKRGIADPTVFKQPRHDACDDCKLSYLEDDGITPRLFRLSELLSNGTNVGKSRSARQPVIESHHPYCACSLFWLPPGFTFDASGRMVYEGT